MPKRSHSSMNLNIIRYERDIFLFVHAYIYGPTDNAINSVFMSGYKMSTYKFIVGISDY